MEHGATGTLSLPGDAANGKVSVVPHLFLVMQAGSRREAPLRLRLDVDEVKLSRASQRHIAVYSDGMRTRLDVGVADNWMSSGHAALIREAAGWRLVDHGSKNGTKINGKPQSNTLLHDEDVLEMGQTFFVFRSRLATRADAPRWFDAGQVGPLAGLATMLPELSERFDELARLSASKSSIVIRGPTGSGKELIARAVHTLSGRCGAFVAVNCAGLPEALVESELFGHVRGAFSGANRDSEGVLMASAKGTLFLDEIGDLPCAAQSKLLRALQEQAVRPVGGHREHHVDLRVVSATHRDLGQLVQAGEFREDLFSRLGSTFELPFLGERREDLGLIVNTLFEWIEDPRAWGSRLSSEVVRAFLNYSWPRNVRELQKALERAIALAGAGPIELAHLPAEVRPQSPAASRPAEPQNLSNEDQAKRARLIELLCTHRGNIAAVAREIGVVRSQVQRWMNRYGVSRDESA